MTRLHTALTLRRLAGALAATLALSASYVEVRAQAPGAITLATGESQTIETPGLTRVAVGDSKIAAVVAIGSAQVVVNGKGPGHTSLFVWDGNGRHDYTITVLEQRATGVADMLRAAIDMPHVRVESFGRDTVVRGSVDDRAQFQKVTDLVSRFEGYARLYKVSIINAVTIARPLGTLQDRLATVPGSSDLHVDADEKGNVVVTGSVPDRATAETVLARVRGLAGPYLPVDGKVIDRLAVATISQVDTKVFVLEVDRTALTQLGVRLQSAIPAQNPTGYTFGDPNFPVIEGPGPYAAAQAPRGSNRPGDAFQVSGFFRNIVLAPTIDAIVRTGHARVLSAPDLVAMPGANAKFLVGGEVPYVISTALGAYSVQFKEYGVKLDITPTILGGGDVESKIAPEVSDLDYTNAVSLNGILLPALKTSRVQTDVITHPGESVVLGGLLRRVETRQLDKLPILGDLPILGKLFRSTRYQNAETDVVFVMTPEVLTR